MRRWIVLTAVIASALTARAGTGLWMVTGGPGKTGDCMSEMLLQWDPAYPENPSATPALIDTGGQVGRVDTKQTCVDGDPCDQDDIPNQCTFKLGFCFAVDDPATTTCGPTRLNWAFNPCLDERPSCCPSTCDPGGQGCAQASCTPAGSCVPGCDTPPPCSCQPPANLNHFAYTFKKPSRKAKDIREQQSRCSIEQAIAGCVSQACDLPDVSSLTPNCGAQIYQSQPATVCPIPIPSPSPSPLFPADVCLGTTPSVTPLLPNTFVPPGTPSHSATKTVLLFEADPNSLDWPRSPLRVETKPNRPCANQQCGPRPSEQQYVDGFSQKTCSDMATVVVSLYRTDSTGALLCAGGGGVPQVLDSNYIAISAPWWTGSPASFQRLDPSGGDALRLTCLRRSGPTTTRPPTTTTTTTTTTSTSCPSPP